MTEARSATRPGTWPASGAALAVPTSTAYAPAAPTSSVRCASDEATASFEACCRALSHKANTALVAQLPVIREGSVIDLTRNYVGAAGLQAISLVLPHNPNAIELVAPRNGVTNDAIVIFCRAMRGHRRLAVLDFSDNTDVSLAGGLALLSLAQQTPSLREVRLTGTHVPPAVLSKLHRALELNGAKPTAAGGPLVPTRPTTTATSSKRIAPGTLTEKEEAALLSALEERVRAAVADGYQLPPAVPLTGWRVLEIPILAPPFLFDTEIQLLCTSVFPRLNDEFACHRLMLRPVVVVGGSASGTTVTDSNDGAEDGFGAEGRWMTERGQRQAGQRTIGSYNRELHFQPVCDVLAAVARGRFAVIELVGDRPGDYAQVPAADMLALQQRCAATTAAGERAGDAATDGDGDDDDTVAPTAVPMEGVEAARGMESPLSSLQPVLYAAHEAALRTTQWLVVATRRETRAMQVPAALAPLLTADPSVAHPDRHRSVVREIVYDAATAAVPAGHEAATLPQQSRRGGGGPSSDADLDARTSVTLTNTASVAGAASAVPRTLAWDYAAEEHQWRRHQAMRRHVVDSAPVKELVLAQYGATFDRTDAHGTMLLKNLEAFEAGVYNRLRVVLRACVGVDDESRNAASAAEATTTTTMSRRGTLTGAAYRASVSDLFHSIAVQKMWDTAYIEAIAAYSSTSIKKNVMNRVVLYAANPPSRNSLILHAHDVAGLATLMARAGSRLQSLQHAYTLALHTTRSAVLLEEPTDLRCFVVAVVSQLTTDASVLRYVHAEVDVERLCAFFVQLLSGTVRSRGKSPATVRAASGGAVAAATADGGATASLMTAAGLPEYVADFTLSTGNNPAESAAATGSAAQSGSAEAVHAFVVLVDGIDQLMPPVQPCGALVHASSGATGSRAEPAKWSDEGTAGAPRNAARPSSGKPDLANQSSTPLSATMPRALARNVRFIASCTTDSAVYTALRHLGRDSVEMLSLGPVSANEVEQYLSPVLLARLGLTFSEDDFECARGKKDAASGEYVRYLLDAARAAHETPGFLTQSQVIQAFPETVAEAAQAVYDRLIHAFGMPLVRNVLGLLTASRWGLTLPELRALLPQLSACRLHELLRLLRPTLEPALPQEASLLMGDASGNALLGTVRVCVPSFLEVVHREALQVVAEEQQIDQDQRVWHSQLAQYYLSNVYTCLSAAKAAPGRVPSAAVTRTTALAEQRRALKEVIYHMTHSGAFWPQLDATILSLPFLQLVYASGLGYAFLRDLTAAFNDRYQRHLLGEDIGETSWQHAQPESTTPGETAEVARHTALPAVLTRMRDYIRFAHDNGLLLSLRPSLVAQVALQIPASALHSVQRDTVTALYRDLLQQEQTAGSGGGGGPRSVFFTLCTSTAAAAQGKTSAATTTTATTHLGPVTCAAFLPNRKFVITASRDRSLAWVHPQSGVVTWYARQPTAPAESLTMCRTSAYVAAVTEDRSVWVYDGLQGKLVTQCRGNEWFDAPIAAVVFSARGRYVWVVTTDTRARCFECESGVLRCSLGVAELLETPPSAALLSEEMIAVQDESALTEEGRKEKSGAAAPVAAYSAMVQQSSSEWRRRRNYLFVLPDRIDDEVCTTVVGGEVRRWRLLPWQNATAGEVTAAADSVIKSKEESKDTLVAFQMIGRRRLTVDVPRPAASTASPTPYEPVGYKNMQPWEPKAAPLFSESSDVVYAFAAPAANGAEVHLLALPFDTVKNNGAVRAAVRCVPPPSGSNGSDAVCVMCPSPDARWLAVGMKSGRIHLFDIAAAYRNWITVPPQPQKESVACEPVAVYTGLVQDPGMTATPIRNIAFHRDGHLLFALGRSLKCWRLPSTTPVPVLELGEVGEYVWSRSPTCLAVLPAPLPPSSDVELPSGVAEVCVGDETGRLTLLKLWRPTYQN